LVIYDNLCENMNHGFHSNPLSLKDFGLSYYWMFLGKIFFRNSSSSRSGHSCWIKTSWQCNYT